MHKMRRSAGDMVFDAVNCTLMSLVLIAVLYPLYFVIIASVSSPALVGSGNVLLYPKGLNLNGYRAIFKDAIILTAYGNSFMYMFLGTAVNMAVTIPAAYSFSRKDLVGRDQLMLLFAFTMYFGGGLIPTYLLIRGLGMANTLWAMVIPGAVSVYNMIIARTFFRSNIPDEMLEAAQIEGCGNIRFFLFIALPLSKAMLAVMVLFFGVGHWNSWFNAMIYLKDENKFPIQLVIRNILLENQMRQEMMQGFDDPSARNAMERAELIKYGMIIVTSVPVLIVYPFVQKYFVKGVMIGAIKG